MFREEENIFLMGLFWKAFLLIPKWADRLLKPVLFRVFCFFLCFELRVFRILKGNISSESNFERQEFSECRSGKRVDTWWPRLLRNLKVAFYKSTFSWR